MYLIIFLILNIFFLKIYYSKLPKVILLIFSLSIIFIEPVFQKLTDPTLFGKSFMIFSLSRLQTYIILIFTYSFILLFPNNKKQVWNFNLFIFLLIIFQILNVIFSLDIRNSFAIFLVGIIFPILYLKFLESLGLEFFMNNESIKRSIYVSIIVFIGVGFIMIGNSGMRVNDIGVNRTAGGLWLSNVSTQVLAIFFPLILLKNKSKTNHLLKIICILLYLVLIIISLSRTGVAVYSLMILLTLLNKKKKINYLFISGVTLYTLFIIVNVIFKIDFLEKISSRFTRKGDLGNTVESDARISILKEIFENFDFSNILIGNGISTFNLINKLGFSNAHNLFVNIFIERGIIGLFLFLFVVFYLLKRTNNYLKNNFVNLEDKEIIKSFRIGFIGFLLIGITGNDLFINSGFINGWPLITIITYYVVLEMKFKKLKNEIKNQKNYNFNN